MGAAFSTNHTRKTSTANEQGSSIASGRSNNGPLQCEREKENYLFTETNLSDQSI
uniref:Uncharacterized protein n=1 Tax=Rhizophora mucronata TaxID=61149 RepID=A0A2P2P2E4_RHIMU